MLQALIRFDASVNFKFYTETYA